MGSEVARYSRSAELPGRRPAVRAALAEYVRRVATEYADEVVSITLYGSQARGDADDESDIDLFVVVRRKTPALEEALFDLGWEVEFEHNVVISDLICGLDELHAMQAKRFPFYQNVEQEGIGVWTNAFAPTRVSG